MSACYWRPAPITANLLDTRSAAAIIEEAGGFKAYEKAHRTRLLATFTPKFTHLVPEELVPLIVDFSFHVGFYVSAAAVAALSRAAETNPN